MRFSLVLPRDLRFRRADGIRGFALLAQSAQSVIVEVECHCRCDHCAPRRFTPLTLDAYRLLVAGTHVTFAL